MTKKQEKALELIEKEVPEFDFHKPENYEIKKWEVKELEYAETIMLCLETGLKGDEDTMARFSRKYRCILIGPRGDIYAFKYGCGIGQNKSKGNGKYRGIFEVMNYGYHTC